MPGRVIMDQQSSETGSQGLKKDRSHAQQGAVQALPHISANSLSAVNGDSAHGQNGGFSNGVPHANDTSIGTNGNAMTSVPMRIPPPLDRSWREAPENKKLGVLMERTAQQCLFELYEVITKMVAEGVPRQGAQAGSTGTMEDTDAISLAKKRQLLDFAQTQRDRFIKALVITDWSRNADEMAKVIDINAYLQKGNWQHSEATRSIGQLKIDMFGARMPNPNLDGALEVLATGKPHGVPDLGYIPAPRLTAKQLLKTLKEMNVTLATRLALHEELPEQFRDYSIKDGRATFSVPGEFEVDLAVADEDFTSSWFFIDIRFLFSPAPEVVDERIKFFFEAEVNKSIAASGLQGCYDVIHNFILTHKINVLHNQANELLRGKWFECIKVERLRRNMVVQYWTGKPGKKSWLEFGIASGKGTKSRPGQQHPTPVIAVRWFQNGIEVQNAVLDIDWQHLDIERILLHTIAKQTASMLIAAQDGLKSLAGNASGFYAEMQTLDREPADRTLLLKLPSLQRPVRVLVESVTGQYSIMPASPAATHAQTRLNNDPGVDAPRLLASTLYASSLALVEKHAAPLGWLPATNLVRQGNLKALFGEDIGNFRLFIPSKQWGDEWAIAVTVGLNGNKWWIAQMKGAPEADGMIINITRQLRGAFNAGQPVSRRFLLQIEKLAVAEVSYTALSLQLQELRIPHHFERPSPLTSNDDSLQDQSATAIFIGFTKLMRDMQDKKWKPWAQEPVRVTHHNDYTRPANDEPGLMRTRHDLRLTLRQGCLKELQRHLTKSRNRDVAMNATGGLALRLYTPFGAPFVDQLRARLSSIRRLDQYVSTLQKCHLRCDMVSLSKLAFTYSKDPLLSAQLTYFNDGTVPVRLRLEPRDSNPHLRIRVLLEHDLNRGTEDAFSQMVHTLLLTLPLLCAIEKLENGHPQKPIPILHVRSATWYSLKYKAPLPQITFQIRTRVKTEGTKTCVRWHMQLDYPKANAESLPEGLLKELREVWDNSTDPYVGVGSGVIGTAPGIALALEKIDSIVRRYEVESPMPKQEAASQPTEQAPMPVKTEREVIALD